MVALNEPAEKDRQSVEIFLNNRKPVADNDWDFIYKTEDLITLRSGEGTAVLDAMMEYMLDRCLQALSRIPILRVCAYSIPWQHKADDDFLENNLNKGKQSSTQIIQNKC